MLPDRDPFDVDVTYNLLEFDIALNEAFASQFSNIELRYAHSRYSSEIGSFQLVNPPNVDLVSSSSDLYLIANTIALQFKTKAIFPASTMEINPVGTEDEPEIHAGIQPVQRERDSTRSLPPACCGPCTSLSISCGRS